METTALEVIEGSAIALPDRSVEPARVEYIDAPETAKLLRAALKREFPGVKFSVRTSTYSMGASIRIAWTDGPSRSDVERIAQQYRGKGFDGSIDLSYRIEHYLMPDGSISIREDEGSTRSRGAHEPVKGIRPMGARAVHFGADYVFCRRHISEAERVRMVGEVQRICQKREGDEWGLWLGDRWMRFANIDAAAEGLSDYRAGRAS